MLQNSSAVIDLNTLSGNDGAAFDINNIGQVAGYVDFAAVHNDTPYGGGGTITGSNNYPGIGNGGDGRGQDNANGVGKRNKPTGSHHGIPLPGG